MKTKSSRSLSLVRHFISFSSSSVSMADSLATAFHIVKETKDGMLFIPICFVLALSSSAQISARIQKISHSLTVSVGTQYHTENHRES